MLVESLDFPVRATHVADLLRSVMLGGLAGPDRLKPGARAPHQAKRTTENPSPK